jgi:hypothetical protein
MIVDEATSHFIFIVPADHVYLTYNYINYKGKELNNKEYLEYWGKWIVWGTKEDLDLLAKKLDHFVEQKLIPAAKYDRAEINEFEFGECVMCIYCDARQKEDVWDILSSLGIEDKAWVFERETVERWLPGGHLLETWIKGKGLNEIEAEKVRQGSRKKFEIMFENEEAIFRGIEQ